MLSFLVEVVALDQTFSVIFFYTRAGKHMRGVP